MTVTRLPAETSFPTIRTMVRLYVRWTDPVTGAEHFYVCTQPLHPKTGKPWQASRGIGGDPGRGSGTYLELGDAVRAYEAKVAELTKRETSALKATKGEW